VEAGLLGAEEAALIALVEDQLAKMSGPEHDDLWNYGALETSTEWREVRRLASAAVAALNVEDRPAAE
jgi:hypothetical protein